MRKLLNGIIEFFYFPFLRFIPLQTFKYAVCGGTTVTIDFVVYWVLHYLVFQEKSVNILNYTFTSHDTAATISFLCSFPVGFVLNKFIVFTESDLRGRVQLIRYGLIVIGSFALSLLFLKTFIEIFGWNATLSKILSTALVIIYSYFSQQYFSFKKSNNNNEIPTSE